MSTLICQKEKNVNKAWLIFDEKIGIVRASEVPSVASTSSATSRRSRARSTTSTRSLDPTTKGVIKLFLYIKTYFKNCTDHIKVMDDQQIPGTSATHDAPAPGPSGLKPSKTSEEKGNFAILKGLKDTKFKTLANKDKNKASTKFKTIRVHIWAINYSRKHTLHCPFLNICGQTCWC